MKNELISNQKPQSPEEIELEAKKTELERASADLAQKELELEDIRLSIARFQHRYYAEVGKRYVKLDELRARIAEYHARQEPDNPEIQQFAENAREEASKTAQEFHEKENDADVGADKGEPPEELKKLYRKIATIVHPDKAVDEQSRELRTKLMAELNDAYAQRDVNRMRVVLVKWEESPESVPGDGTAAELVRTIRAIAQVKRRIKDIEQELAAIVTEDIYQLMIKCHEADANGKNLLLEMAESIDSEIQNAETELQSLLGE